MSGHSSVAYLGLGSSLGDRMAHLRRALTRLQEPGGRIRVTAVSPVYQSPHMGLETGDERMFPPHLNCVARVETQLSPEALLERIHEIEDAGGRRRDRRWGPRTIDIDILSYDDVQMETATLVLPHPGIGRRAFVLRPLADINPDLRLPDGRAVGAMLEEPEIMGQSLQRYAMSGGQPDELFL